MNKKRNLILVHENQTKLLITYKHSRRKYETMEIKNHVNSSIPEAIQLMDDSWDEAYSNANDVDLSLIMFQWKEL